MNKAAGSEVLTAGPGLVSARARRLAAAKIGGKAMDMVNAQQALRTAALVFLGIGAGFDLRKRALPSLYLAAAFAVGSVLAVFFRDGFPWTYLLSLLPGLFLLFLAPATRGGIGAGDGLLMIAVGTVLPVEDVLAILLVGLLSASFYAAVLLFRRRGRNTSFPLIPFLHGGCLAFLILGSLP